jgi:hypothetical protein
MNSFQKSAGAMGLCAASVITLVSCGAGSSSQPSPTAQSQCKPGVISGFQGGFTDQTTPVPPRPADQPNSNSPIASADGGGDGGTGESGGGGGGDGGSGGGDGAGSGGSMGQFINTIVRAERSDGKLIGQAVTDPENGMVTIVSCGYSGPVHVTMKAKEDGSSKYFEESTGQYAAYPKGTEMHAVVPTLDKNMGVTLLTEAAWQYMLAKHGPEGWKNPANVLAANEFIRTEFNKFLPQNLQLTDITRLPFLVGANTQPGTLTTSPNDVYGIVSSALARSAGLMRSGDLEPALKLVKQLGQDLCDGEINLLGCDGQPVVADTKDAAYLPPQFGETLNRAVGDVVAACGNADAINTSFRVTQIAIDIAGQEGANGTFWLGTYSEKQPIYLLRSDGRAFYWKNRDIAPEPYLPTYSFSRIFSPIDGEMGGVTQDGQFVLQGLQNLIGGVTQDIQSILPDLTSLITRSEFFGATATVRSVGSALGVAQISRLQNGRVKYFPHYEDGDASWQPTTKEATLDNKGTPLDNITSIAVSRDYRGLFGTGDPTAPPSNATIEPTFYASTGDGSVYAWGNDRKGALGDGSPSKNYASLGTGLPKKIMSKATHPYVTSVVGMRNGAMALDIQGGIWAWGGAGVQTLLEENKAPGPDGFNVPFKLTNFDDFRQNPKFGRVVQISCAYDLTCAALTQTGQMLAWGFFGENFYVEPKIPGQYFGVKEVPLPAGRRVTYLGNSHNMVYAVLDDGQLVVLPHHPTDPQFIDTKKILPAPTAGAQSPTCVAKPNK